MWPLARKHLVAYLFLLLGAVGLVGFPFFSIHRLGMGPDKGRRHDKRAAALVLHSAGVVRPKRKTNRAYFDRSTQLGGGITVLEGSSLPFTYTLEHSVFYEDEEVLVEDPPQSLAPRRLLLSPSSCPPSNFVMMIHIRVEEFNRRNEWRYTYNPFKTSANFSLFFAVGCPKNQSLYKALQNEHTTHGDLVLGDFVDDYKNMTLKHLAHLRYFHEHCAGTKFLVKLDDDVAVNMATLSKFISSIHDGPAPWFGMDTSYGPKIWCQVWENTVVRRSISLKWAVTRSRWHNNTWPDYCAGLGYVATQPAVGRLIQAAEKERWLWVDDIFITGILSQRGQVQLVQASKFYSMDEENEFPFVWGQAMFALTWRNETWNFFDIVN